MRILKALLLKATVETGDIGLVESTDAEGHSWHDALSCSAH